MMLCIVVGLQGLGVILQGLRSLLHHAMSVMCLLVDEWLSTDVDIMRLEENLCCT